MCRVALDQAITLADLGHASYVASTALDASNLMIAIVGFLPATDPADARDD
jgi:hypothetical protein